MSGKFFFSTVSLELYCSAPILWDQLCICGRNAVRFRAVVASDAPWRAFLVTSPPLLHRPWVLVTMKPPRGNRSPYGAPPWNHAACRLSIGCPMEEAPESHDRLMSREAPQPSNNSQYPASGSRWPESESRTSPTLFECSVQVRFRKGRVSLEADLLAATVRSLTAKAASTRGKDMQVIVTNMQAPATQGSRAGRAGLLSKR
jgi:hypothetical protein